MPAVTADLDDLLEDTKNRADLPSSGAFRTDAYITKLINDSIEEVYDELRDAGGFFDYVGKVATISGTSPLSLPSDFLDFHALIQQGGYERVYRLPYEWRPFAVEVTGSRTYTLDYIPKITPLATGTDTFTFASGWTQYVAARAAAQLLIQEESDPSGQIALADQRLQKMRRVMSRRDGKSIRTVRDERGRWFPSVTRRIQYYRPEENNTVRIFDIVRRLY